MKKPAGPAYTLSRVMPRVWSWYHVVAARPGSGTGTSAKPGPRWRRTWPPPWPRRSRTTCLRWRSRRGCCWPRAGTTPRRSRRSRRRRRRRRGAWVTIGTGPVYGPGVVVERRSRVTPADAARRVGPVQGGVDRQQVRAGSCRCASTSSLIHLTRTGRLYCASIVSDGALWSSRPRLLCAAFRAVAPHGRGREPRGRICWTNCLIEIS